MTTTVNSSKSWKRKTDDEDWDDDWDEDDEEGVEFIYKH